MKMKLRITVDDTVLTATMLDTTASKDFMALLPLTVTLKDYAGEEKVCDLPKKLSTQGSPAGYDPELGDITYYAPWGNLALFYHDRGYAQGLVKLGHLDGGVDLLAGKRTDISARFETLP